MDIKPTDKTIKNLLEAAFFKIPRFQRPYSWDRENVEEFWTDVIVSDDADYFIGSFVLYGTQGADTFHVVDGQQRLTTITLLLAAIRDSLDELGEDELAKGVHGLIERKDINNHNQFVLQSETPYPYLQEHIQKYGEPEVEVEIGSEEEALESAYTFLKEQITGALDAIEADTTISAKKKPDKKKQRLLLIRDKLLRLQLISITLGNEDEAYLIFETLNTRGKDLTVSDLVKNHLTRLLKPKNKGVDTAKDKWLGILELFDSSEAEIDVNRFLHHSWLSREPYTTEKRLFKEIKKTVDKAKANEFLDDLIADATIYRTIFEPGWRKWKKEERECVNAIRALNLFRVIQPVPMVMSLLRAYNEKRLTLKQLRNVLACMENFHVQFTAVTSQRTGGGTAFMYAASARDITTAKDGNQAQLVLKGFIEKLRERVPIYEEFEAGMLELQLLEESTKQRGLVHYLLSRFDRYMRHGDVVDYDAMTIEHLEAQNPEGGSAVPLEAIGEIGNLILIPEKLNVELANKPFKKKVEVLQAKGVPLDDEIKNASKWTADQIRARTKYLAKLGHEKVFKV